LRLEFGTARLICDRDQLMFVATSSITLRKDQHVIRDSDLSSVLKCDWHYHTLAVYEGSISAAKIDELVLPAVVAADDRMLPRGKRAEIKTDRILPGSADCGRVPDYDFKRLR
jgi:hypothetical protein